MGLKANQEHQKKKQSTANLPTDNYPTTQEIKIWAIK
jgi:hypothetical protein